MISRMIRSNIWLLYLRPATLRRRIWHRPRIIDIGLFSTCSTRILRRLNSFVRPVLTLRYQLSSWMQVPSLTRNQMDLSATCRKREVTSLRPLDRQHRVHRQHLLVNIGRCLWHQRRPTLKPFNSHELRHRILNTFKQSFILMLIFLCRGRRAWSTERDEKRLRRFDSSEPMRIEARQKKPIFD